MGQFSLRAPRSKFLSSGFPIIGVVWALVARFAFTGNLFFGLFCGGLGLLASALVFLLQHWSVWISSALNTSSATIDTATQVLVYPPPHKGTPGFATLVRDTHGVHFQYQQKKFIWRDNTFSKLDFPVSLTFGHYRNSKGVESAEALGQLQSKFGANSVDLPAPQFKDLYKEHALAPFFVLQIFFILLWCLDEYWMYAILTGIMLALMEALTVWKRLKTIRFLRSMIQGPSDLAVCRLGKWVKLMSSELVPGDVFEVKQGLIPCDAVLLSGSCVVNESSLTGENVALLKDSIGEREEQERLDFNAHRTHLLFGGTKVMQATAEAEAPRVTAMALRTGFASSQGKVLRTIAFASETVSANSAEALFFILFLLCFAIVAASYVLLDGLQNPDKSPYKLLLECIIILTAVVPPELPIELALAVTASLTALRAIRVFCTEPFRIPLAGKLDVCAFDKTGTLTRDDLLFSGFASAGSVETVAPFSQAVSDEALLVVASCHSLSQIGGKAVGDPLEMISLEKCGWKLLSGRAAGHSKRKMRTEILFRYHFNAALRRMTTVASVSHPEATFRVCSKGAPEVIRSLLRAQDRTEAFERTYRHFALLGYRVIALAFKDYPQFDKIPREELSREELEKDLIFGGFLIFECPLRTGTEGVLKQLRDAGILNVMITGDSELTAVAVAQQTGMTQLPPLVLDSEDASHPVWRVPVEGADNTSRGVEFRASEMRQLRKGHTLCIKGSSLEYLSRFGLGNVLPLISVFARCSPTHKEMILLGLGRGGARLHTLMCGDGTNDVGALKQADVGVALVFDPEAELQKGGSAAAGPAKPVVSEKEAKKSHQQQQKQQQQQPLVVERVTGIALVDKFLALSDKQDKLDEAQSMSMGDASIAAPFTVRAHNVSPVLDIVRQGRCSLVTTLQMYFILALNCLITAFSLSVLHLQGVRFGDAQMTISALISTACFLFISRSKPLEKLAPQKPRARIFTPYFLTSLMLQFAVHLGCLLAAVHYTQVLTPNFVASKAESFAPNVMNTAVFLISAAMQLATFTVNYQGHPFMMSLSENKPLRNTLTVGYAIVASAALGLLNSAIALSPLEPALRQIIIGLMLLDLAGAKLAEGFAGLVFAKHNKPLV